MTCVGVALLSVIKDWLWAVDWWVQGIAGFVAAMVALVLVEVGIQLWEMG